MKCYACSKGIKHFSEVVGLNDEGEVALEPVPLNSTFELEAGWYPLCEDCGGGGAPGGKLAGPGVHFDLVKGTAERIPAHPEYQSLMNRLYTRLHTQGGVRLV